MFAFLTRLGRLFVATIVLGGVISILGAMSITGVLVASHHNASASAACSVSATAVGSPLNISGTGYQPSTSYEVKITWPNNAGVAGEGVWSNSSGSIFVSNYAYWAGTYQVGVYSTSGNQSLLASCSTTVS